MNPLTRPLPADRKRQWLLLFIIVAVVAVVIWGASLNSTDSQHRDTCRQMYSNTDAANASPGDPGYLSRSDYVDKCMSEGWYK